MSSLTTSSQLRYLRPSDRLRYKGVTWDIIDYSTYKDSHGYQTEEWLLQYQRSKNYYLLLEYDPKNEREPWRWYLAEKIQQPRLFLPESSPQQLTHLWEDMQRKVSPYPRLKLFNIIYYFESQTAGNYQENSTNEYRITWEYWDLEHKNNLALEAWDDGTLSVYLSKVVNPEEFDQIEKAVTPMVNLDSKISYSSEIQLKIIASVIMMIAGLLFMIFG